MYNESQLIEIASKNNIECYEISNRVDNAMLIQDMTFDEFIKFVIKRGIDTIFYRYTYVDLEDFVINESTCRPHIYERNLVDFIRCDIDIYNEMLATYDFKQPYRLMYYCIYNGQIVGNIVRNESFRSDIMLPEDAFRMLLSISEKEVKEKEEEYRARQEKLRNEFKQELMASEELEGLTNISLRRSFARKVLDMPQYKKYSDGFDYTSHTPTIIEFIECVYSEYKQEKAKNNIVQ